MTEIVRQWIQEKLGVIINLRPETFCDLTRDGYLLSKILRSYDVINEDQFRMIRKSSTKEICLYNFQNHIVNWLKIINVQLKSEEIIDIVENRGLTSLSLFYRMFLELHEKDCLTFITRNRLSEKLRPQISKFTVVKVKENPLDNLKDIKNKYKDHVQHSYDVIHWLQDRFEMVVSKCKTAREDYLSLVRNSERKISNSFSVPANIFPRDVGDVERISPKSINLTYQELVEEVGRVKTFMPNILEAKQVLEKIREKLKQKSENEIFRKELEQYLREVFWDRVIIEESGDFHRHITEKILKQSLYEKQMLKKLEEVKLQKEEMLKSKKLIADQLSKENEAVLLQKLLEKDVTINNKEFQYYLEKERACQLHRALYKEMLRLKEERRLKLCLDTVKAICDVAVKYSEYQDFFGEPPTRQVTDNWNKRIVEGQPIDEPEFPMTTLIDDNSEIPEKIIHKEIEKQDVLDEKDFESYLMFEWPWLLTNEGVKEELVYEMNCGMNILGHIVNLLLLEKYPFPPLPPPPNLPKVHFRVCINGLPDTSCLFLLAKLLNYKNILVIELQDAVNYCIEAFKKEAYAKDEDDTKETANGEKPIEVEEGKKMKGKKNKAKNKLKKQVDEPKISVDDKIVQTPRIYPCEEIVFSPHAELGRIAEEELSKGKPLTDYLLVSLFIEYLRAQTDIGGWVLINYPTNFEQAVLLEEGLSGLKVPGVYESTKICKSLIDIVYVCEQDEPIPDPDDDRRYSKLVYDPAEPIEPPPYDTVLTAFVDVCPDEDIVQELEAIEASSVSEEEKLEEPQTLQKFYTDMGCHYSLYYKNFDYSTVKQLGKLVIGDFRIPLKSSVELFGDTVRYIEAEKVMEYRNFKYIMSGEKVDRERIEKVVKKPGISKDPSKADIAEKIKRGKKDKGKKEKKGRKKSKKGKTGVIIIHEDKYTQIPEVTIIEIEEEDIQQEKKPGEPGWKYLNLILSEKISGFITDFWEHMEEVYINDFTQVLFMKKAFLNTLMPYTKYIKSFMTKHIIKPDDRQIYLVKFQENFNKFDMDFRRDREFKAELHCLVNELRNKLLDICDKKMMAGEQERRNLIYERWGPRQMIELVNNYLNGFQLELDRHVDSLMFINDYFTGLVAQLPSEEDITKETIPKFELENKTIHKIVTDYLLEVPAERNEEIQDKNEAIQGLKNKLAAIYHTAVTIAQKRGSTAFACFDKVKSLFRPEDIKVRGNKKASKPGKGAKSLLTIFEPSEIVKQNEEKIFEEWTCALKGEIARIQIRLLLLRHDLYENVELFVNTIKRTFDGIFNDNRSRYEREVDCITKACYIISTAVEKEVPIQEELLFIDDEFLINAATLMFESQPDKIVEELPSDFVFTIAQLNTLITIFLDLSQTGFIPHTTFIFILQDVVANDEVFTAPARWKKLSGYKIRELSHKIFNNQKYVHWKDFIIYNLMLNVPSDLDIINMRNQFIEFDPECTELISKENFKKVHFWFEDQYSNSDESWLVKNLLFRMYQSGQKTCSYTALLLDFCKGECTQEGIAKALAVICGKPMCWKAELGKTFVDETLTKRQIHEEEVRLREEEIRANLEFAETIIDTIIDTTVHTCDSVIITDIPLAEEEDAIEEKHEEKEPVRKSSETEKIKAHKEVTISKTSIKKTATGKTNIEKKLSRDSRASMKKKRSSKIERLINQDENISEVKESILSKTEQEPMEKTVYESQEKISPETCSPEPQFSNVVIGFEPQISPPLKYFLLFEDITTVLFKTLSDVMTSNDKKFFDIICDIYQECKNPDFNREVLCHEFFNNEKFLQLMEDKTKFIMKIPGRIVQDMLELEIN